MQHYSMEIDREDDHQFSEIADKFGEKLTLESSSSTQLVEEVIHDEDDVVYVIEEDDDDDEDEDGEEEEGEFEFSFGGGEVHSPVSAEEAFHNGQIRPIFPFFGENLANSDEVAAAEAAGKSSYGPPVKKVFVVSSTSEDDNVAEGPYCVWSTEESAGDNPAAVAAPEMSRKSNSTGFSRLWRMKDLLVRSNSDGKDTFVFLTGKSTAAAMSKEAAEKKKKKVMSLSKIKVGGGRNDAETTSSSSSSATANAGGHTAEKKKKKKKVTMTASTAAYEALYGKKEKKKGGGKSYLPYRQDLVGFFTNVNGMTRNVHPY